MDGTLDQVLTAVGPRLRTLRQRRAMTLADLSAATDISVSQGVAPVRVLRK